MDLLPLLGNLFSLMGFGLILAGILKTFQMAGDLSEIKDLLSDIKRNTEANSVTPYQLPAEKSHAAPLREMDDQSYAAAIQASIRGESSPAPLARAVEAASQVPQNRE